MAIVGVALLVRAITALQIAALPLSRNPHFDSLEYLGWARRVAAGDFTWPVLPPHGPGYPYVLGALLAIFGGSLVAVVVVQSIVGALTGAILGLATLIRPTALILLPLFLFFGARTWRLRGVMAAVTIAVIAPVTIANWRTSHAFIPVQAFGGINVYLGTSPLRDGLASARPGADWERIEPEAAR